MPVLSRAPQDIRDFVAQVTEDYHAELKNATVTVGVLMASPTEKEMGEPAPHLKHNGYGAAAVIGITPIRQRVMGIADAVITLDDETWRSLDEDGREALIDHELAHLIVCRDEDDQVKFDDCNRPKLKMRLHDIQIGVFSEIIARHGMKSIDAQNVRLVYETYKQKLFSWGSDLAAQDEAPTAADVLGRSA